MSHQLDRDMTRLRQRYLQKPNPRKVELIGESTDEESRPEYEKTKKSQEDKIRTRPDMGLQNEK